VGEGIVDDGKGGKAESDRWVAGDSVGRPACTEYEHFDDEANPAGDFHRCFAGPTGVVEDVKGAPEGSTDQGPYHHCYPAAGTVGLAPGSDAKATEGGDLEAKA
jgi:hypothetical protein